MAISRRARLAALVSGVLFILLSASGVAAHESRVVGEYRLTVGFLAEPVFVDQKSGLDLRVVTPAEPADARQPVEGLEDTIKATLTKDGVTRDMPITARFGDPGAYQSPFYPTVEGSGYEIRFYGTINGMAIDEKFTSGPETFGVINSVTDAQFPTKYPPTAELVSDVESTSSQFPIALGLGAIAAVLAVIALILAITGRRRAA